MDVGSCVRSHHALTATWTWWLTSRVCGQMRPFLYFVRPRVLKIWKLLSCCCNFASHSSWRKLLCVQVNGYRNDSSAIHYSWNATQYTIHTADAMAVIGARWVQNSYPMGLHVRAILAICKADFQYILLLRCDTDGSVESNYPDWIPRCRPRPVLCLNFYSKMNERTQICRFLHPKG